MKNRAECTHVAEVPTKDGSCWTCNQIAAVNAASSPSGFSTVLIAILAHALVVAVFFLGATLGGAALSMMGLCDPTLAWIVGGAAAFFSAAGIAAFLSAAGILRTQH